MAIETSYKGYRFRSRLEARWAVFFETMGYDWRYEHEGYERGGERYLPDFEITNKNGDVYFIEVKGVKDALVKDFDKMVTLLDWGGCLPEFDDSFETQKTGLILLGEIPLVMGVCFHPIIQHHEGLCRSWAYFWADGVSVHLAGKNDLLSSLFNMETDWGLDGDGKNWLIETREAMGSGRHIPNVAKAYEKARSARFEHGERP